MSKGPPNNGLYMLKNRKFSVYFSDRHVATLKAIWPLRLGHSNCKVLHNLNQARKLRSI